MRIVHAQALTVRYGAREALSSLDLAIESGITGLLGPNGAGKSTFLKTLLGFLTPAGGTVEVLGRPASRTSSELRRALGYFPERAVYHPGAERGGERRARRRDWRARAARRPRARARDALVHGARRGPVSAGRRVLDGDAPANQARDGARARPGPPSPGRADERPRPRGAKADARPGAGDRTAGDSRSSSRRICCTTWRTFASAWSSFTTAAWFSEAR